MHEIVLTETAKAHYEALDASARSSIRKGIRDHLAHEPEKVSKSRIKRLRELEHPEYRLRLDPYRVFYDVIGTTVVVIAIVPKTGTEEWLERHGVRAT